MFNFKKISRDEYKNIQSTRSIGGSTVLNNSWALGLKIEQTSAMMLGTLLHEVILNNYNATNDYSIHITRGGERSKTTTVENLKSMAMGVEDMHSLIYFENNRLPLGHEGSINEYEPSYVCETTDIPLRCQFDYTIQDGNKIALIELKSTRFEPSKITQVMFEEMYANQIKFYMWCADKIHPDMEKLYQMIFAYKNGIDSKLFVTSIKWEPYTDEYILGLIETGKELINGNSKYKDYIMKGLL